MVYWTKEKCQEIALKYKNKQDFRNGDNYPYTKSQKKGWLDDICSHMVEDVYDRGYWSYERCVEEIKKYNNISDFRKKSRCVYTCIKNNWLGKLYDIVGFEGNKKRDYWTKENCQEESLKYNTRTDFRINSYSAYKKSLDNNWLDDICSHMKVVGNLYKRCIYVFEFSDKNAYIGLTYDYNDRIGKHIIDEKSSVYKHLNSMSGLTYETKKLTDYVDVEKAKKLEGKYVKMYEKDGWFILNRIKTGGVGGKINLTKEKCHEDALNYNTRTDFRINKQSSYNRARKKKWLDEICSHMKSNKSSGGCLICGDKNEDNFYKDKNVCKKCISVQKKKYYNKNKETILERNRNYKENNKEKVRKKEKEYRENHIEYYLEYSRKYRLENREYFIEYSKKYREKYKTYFKNYHVINSDKFQILDDLIKELGQEFL